jgi:hypothetical protein
LIPEDDLIVPGSGRAQARIPFGAQQGVQHVKILMHLAVVLSLVAVLGCVDFKLEVPGDFVLVDHSIFRTDRGAVGILSASGEPAPTIFHSNHPAGAGSGH